MISINKKPGFTLVELLIVIVVIAILAAISVVAYNGVQNRTNDTAVQSDLRNFANKLMEYHAINGVYPRGSNTNQPVGMEYFSVSKSSYDTSGHNFVYCASNSYDKFIVTARSKSGKRFAYSSDQGLHLYNQTWGGVIDVCNNAGTAFSSHSFSYGYRADGVWWPWVQ